MRKKLFSTGLNWLWLAVLILIMDRFTKYWMLYNLIPFHPVTVLPFFNFTLAYNTGAAFSFLHSASGWQNLLLGAIASIVSILIIYWLIHLSSRERWTCSALCLILGGALGNVWDRILYGYVIDFFDFHLSGWHFAIFNVADSAICIGAFMLMLQWMRQRV